MFKELFEATEELADIQARLPKNAGRRPKLSACANCCMVLVCCSCCWMDDGRSSKILREKAKKRATEATRRARAKAEAASRRSDEERRAGSASFAASSSRGSIASSVGRGAWGARRGALGDSLLGGSQGSADRGASSRAGYGSTDRAARTLTGQSYSSSNLGGGGRRGSEGISMEPLPRRYTAPAARSSGTLVPPERSDATGSS
jgi:hypothetical protein